MIDWFVLLSPLLLLPIALLFLFVGCVGDDPVTTTSAPPQPSAPPAPQPGQPPGPTGPTRFRLNPDKNLQAIPTGFPAKKVRKITVSFTMSQLGVPGSNAPPDTMVLTSSDPTDTAISPTRDTLPPVDPPPSKIGANDLVTCECTVTLSFDGPSPQPEDVKVGPTQFGMQQHATHIFRLGPGIPSPGSKTRPFYLIPVELDA